MRCDTSTPVASGIRDPSLGGDALSDLLDYLLIRYMIVLCTILFGKYCDTMRYLDHDQIIIVRKFTLFGRKIGTRTCVLHRDTRYHDSHNVAALWHNRPLQAAAVRRHCPAPRNSAQFIARTVCQKLEHLCHPQAGLSREGCVCTRLGLICHNHSLAHSPRVPWPTLTGRHEFANYELFAMTFALPHHPLRHGFHSHNHTHGGWPSSYSTRGLPLPLSLPGMYCNLQP